MVKLKVEGLKIGTDLGEYEYRLTPGRIISYLEATDDQTGWYGSDSPYGEPVAPPTVCDNDAYWLPGYQKLFIKNFDSLLGGLMHAKQEFEFFNPARPGKKLKVTGRVVDIYNKRGRTWAVIDSRCVDEEGLDIVHSRLTVCWIEAV